MKGPLSEDEVRLIRLFGLRRFILNAILVIGIGCLTLFLLAIFDVTDWSFDYSLGTHEITHNGLLAVIGLVAFFGAGISLETIHLRESVHYVRIAVNPSKMIGDRAYDEFYDIFTDVTSELIHSNPGKALRILEKKGWPRDRAKYFVTFTFRYLMSLQFKKLLTYVEGRFTSQLARDGWRKKWSKGACDAIRKVYKKTGVVMSPMATWASFVIYGSQAAIFVIGVILLCFIWFIFWHYFPGI